jgi:exosome complex RNA-binding protein Rrp4
METYQPPIIRAGDPISAGSSEGARLLTGTQNQSSIRIDNWLGQITTSEGVTVVAGKTGYMHTTTFMVPGRKNKQSAKVAIDIVPLSSNKYLPQENDLVIGTILQRNFEFYVVDINSCLGNANLPTLAFQGATKTNKPNYAEGTLVFCRVTKADP